MFSAANYNPIALAFQQTAFPLNLTFSLGEKELTTPVETF